MGCDIHLHIEIMIDDKWEHYSAPKIDRNYELFGLMAGVRDETIEPICLPKGIKDIEDMTTITRFDMERAFSDWHHFSWFNKNEIEKFSEEITKSFIKDNGYPVDLEQDIFHLYLFGDDFHGPYRNEIQDVRFIFWFDN
jgi:hypothetical protein